MQNWEIADTTSICGSKGGRNEKDDLIFDIITEPDDYNYNEKTMKEIVKSQIENINSIANKINKEKTELVNSFPSCSLGIINNLTQINASDEEQMDIDQLSISNSDIRHSNDSPIFNSQSNVDIDQSLSDSLVNHNIS
ncbi:hypothetical protein RS030_172650 [Cryptosporidium xiaoi]|uniref:Uncharacterized protein n=1 Tax=Cryptosporidium xiaoi TaxID=659607 RepID=A0AAV9Y067_9CRYT